MEGMIIKEYLGGVVSKFLNKFIERRVGYKPKVSLNSFDFVVEEDTVQVDLKVTMTKEDFDKLIEEVTK